MPLRLTKRPGSEHWYLRGTVRGQRVYETTGTPDRAQAEVLRAKRETELYEASIFGPRVTVTFARAALDYLEFEKRSPATKRYVARLVGYFGHTKLSKIDQTAADNAVKAILKPDAAPATKIRTVYTPLTAILTHAHYRKWCDMPSFIRPTPSAGKTRWLTPAEAQKLLDGAAPHLKPLLHFILCTGARLAEVLELQWSDVDLAEREAVFRDVKNGRAKRTKKRIDRPVALPDAAIALLANLPGRDGHVFRRDDGEPYIDRNREEGGQIKTAFRTACRRAGLGEWCDHEEFKDEKGMPIRIFVPNLTPHDLRHTWATWFYGVTKDLLKLRTEGCWASVDMVERYAHLMPSELVPEIRKIWGDSYPGIGILPSGLGAWRTEGAALGTGAK